MASRHTVQLLPCDYLSKQPHWLDKEIHRLINPYEVAFPSTINALTYIAFPDILSVTGRGCAGLDYAVSMKPLHSGTNISGYFSAKNAFNFSCAGNKHLCGLPDLAGVDV